MIGASAMICDNLLLFLSELFYRYQVITIFKIAYPLKNLAIVNSEPLDTKFDIK